MKDHYVTATKTTFLVEQGVRKTLTTERVPAKTKTVKAGVLVKIEDEKAAEELLALKAIRKPIVGEIVRNEDGKVVEVTARGSSETTDAAKVAQAGQGNDPKTPTGVQPPLDPEAEKETLLARAKEIGVRGASKNWPADTLRNKINEREAEIAAEEREKSNGGPGANDGAGGEGGEGGSDDDTGGVV